MPFRKILPVFGVLVLSAGSLCAQDGFLDVGAGRPLGKPAAVSNIIQLDGSGSNDADGDNLVYHWRQVGGPRVKLLQGNTAKPSFNAEETGEYSFELVVFDGKARSKPAIVNVLVEQANEAPVAAINKKLTLRLGEKATLNAAASSDADGDTLVYNWRQLSGPGKVFGEKISHEPSLSFYPSKEGVYVFELKVNDGKEDSAPVRCIMDVIRPNTAPVAMVKAPQRAVIKTRTSQVAISFGDEAIERSKKSIKVVTSETEEVDISASKIKIPDDFGDDLFTDPSDITETATTDDFFDRLSEEPEQKKAYHQAVDDKKYNETSYNSDDTIDTNIAPVASTSGNMNVAPGQKVVLRGYGIDPDGDNLEYVWRQTAGPVIPGGPIKRKNLAFIPRKQGVYIFELTVNDGKLVSEGSACAVTVENSADNDLMSLRGGNGKNRNNVEVIVPGVDPIDDGVAPQPRKKTSFRNIFRR